MARVRSGLSARGTNLAVLTALLLVFATGAGAMATGSSRGRWVVIAHGIGALALLFLIPWKSIVVRRAWRRRRATRWASLVLVVLVLAAIGAGLASATGLVGTIAGSRMLWWHVALALVLVPLLLFHLVTRPLRRKGASQRGTSEKRTGPNLRRWVRIRGLRTWADPGRRAALRLGAVAGLAAATYVVTEVGLRVAGAPGARRRFTGSYEVGSDNPAAMPATIWLNDTVPAIDGSTWRLHILDAAGRRELSLADLARPQQTVRALLDCTSGWYADQEWTGTPVSSLITVDGGTRSLLVHSVTGYWIRFPIGEIDRLLLATRVGGQALRPGHGYPLRLVAPGRRGFWWVKWVDRIEVQRTPAWWQPPFPVT